MKVRDIKSIFVLLTLFPLSLLTAQEADHVDFWDGWESGQMAVQPTVEPLKSVTEASSKEVDTPAQSEITAESVKPASETQVEEEKVEFFGWKSVQAEASAQQASAPETQVAEAPTQAEERVDFFEGWESVQVDAAEPAASETQVVEAPSQTEEKIDFFEGWESAQVDAAEPAASETQVVEAPSQTEEKVEFFEGWEQTEMAEAPTAPSMEEPGYSETASSNEQMASEAAAKNAPLATAQHSSEPCDTDIEHFKETKVIIEETKGLVLVDDEYHLMNKEELKNISGVTVSHIQLPGSLNDLQMKLDPIYRGQPLTLRKIKELKKVINAHFIENGFPFTMVRVPKQCISTGVLQLIVCQSKLGNIVVEGNRWTCPDLILQYIKTKPGDCIRSNNMVKDINFINRNPYRRVNAIYAPGKEPCTTDLILAMDDRKPYRLYAGADNTGPVRIRRQRVFTGLGVAKMFGLDHYLNFQYTSSYNNRAFQGYTGQYVIFLPFENVFNVFGGYSVIQSDLPFPEVKNQGVFIQASGRYTIPTIVAEKIPLEVTAGFDFKRTNTTLLFTQVSTGAPFPNSNQAANLSQFMVDFRTGYEGVYSRWEWVSELYFSPCEMLPDETAEQYTALRPGAASTYLYTKLATRYTQWLPADFEMFLWLRGQLSDKALLPSEQYGIGGHDTVRGYDEFQLAMDDAFNVNFELRSPAIQLISTIRKMEMKDALQFLVFLDYGVGTNKIVEPGENSPSWLMGFGPGLRYTLDPYVAIRLDWGWKLNKVPSNSSLPPYSGGDSMVHFSAVLSY